MGALGLLVSAGLCFWGCWRAVICWGVSGLWAGSVVLAGVVCGSGGCWGGGLLPGWLGLWSDLAGGCCLGVLDLSAGCLWGGLGVDVGWVAVLVWGLGGWCWLLWACFLGCWLLAVGLGWVGSV